VTAAYEYAFMDVVDTRATDSAGGHDGPRVGILEWMNRCGQQGWIVGAETFVGAAIVPAFTHGYVKRIPGGVLAGSHSRYLVRRPTLQPTESRY